MTTKKYVVLSTLSTSEGWGEKNFEKEGLKMIGFIKAFLLVLRLGSDRILKLEKESRTDSLTGLLNRRGFLEKLELEKARSDRYDHQFLVAYLDLDGLKEINDTQGHQEGDRALISLAARVKKSCRQSGDFAARLGGDEFVVVFVEVKGPNEILERLSMEAKNVSIGSYHYQSSLGISVDDIMRFAETEMREEKKKRKKGR